MHDLGYHYFGRKTNSKFLILWSQYSLYFFKNCRLCLIFLFLFRTLVSKFFQKIFRKNMLVSNQATPETFNKIIPVSRIIDFLQLTKKKRKEFLERVSWKLAWPPWISAKNHQNGRVVTGTNRNRFFPLK